MVMLAPPYCPERNQGHSLLTRGMRNDISTTCCKKRQTWQDSCIQLLIFMNMAKKQTPRYAPADLRMPADQLCAPAQAGAALPYRNL